MQPLSGNQRPDLLTALMNMSLVLRLPREIHFADPRQMSHACHRFWKCYKTLTFCSLLTRCTIPCACHAKRQSERLKVLRTPTVFCTFDFEMCFAPQATRACLVCFVLLTCKCASRHNGVHFFDIATSKSAPNVRCFLHFVLAMCFAPQRRALFRHLNFQKWSENGVFCTF